MSLRLPSRRMRGVGLPASSSLRLRTRLSTRNPIIPGCPYLELCEISQCRVSSPSASVSRIAMGTVPCRVSRWRGNRERTVSTRITSRGTSSVFIVVFLALVDKKAPSPLPGVVVSFKVSLKSRGGAPRRNMLIINKFGRERPLIQRPKLRAPETETYAPPETETTRARDRNYAAPETETTCARDRNYARQRPKLRGLSPYRRRPQIRCNRLASRPCRSSPESAG